MRILVTGADGFIGKNLVVRLSEQPGCEVLRFTRQTSADDLAELVCDAEFIIHLAGVNRPADPAEFSVGNAALTDHLCSAVQETGLHIPIVYASSTQAGLDNPYGQSKRAAEESLLRLHERTGNPIHLLRLPNVFGKWSRPNYNSVVANFCHNVARQLPLRIDDPNVIVQLLYVDDLITTFIELVRGEHKQHDGFVDVGPIYRITVGELAEQICAFENCRSTLISERVGTGLRRALYATYVSHLPTERFAYALPAHTDPRGTFVEMLKTPDAGQFSYFTAYPGVTRGGHYHHSKTEKFLVISGEALFRFRHIITGEWHEIRTTGSSPKIVETIPGWTHDITNVGSELMLVMLWANEIFDRQRPDTIAMRVSE